jgi:putative addiction module component (TIGR02574 family)
MNIQEILKLPASERLKMVEQIWDSLDPNEIQISQSQKDELDHRIDLDRAGKMSWYSVDEVKTLLQNRK